MSIRFQIPKTISRYLDITKKRCKSVKTTFVSRLPNRSASTAASTTAKPPIKETNRVATASNEMKPYIVIYKQGAPDSEIDAEIARVQKAGGKLKQRYDSPIMRGFAAVMPENFAQGLTTKSLAGGDAQIEYVEPDSEVHTQ
ncbi:hypothetical protein IE81DRAFT_320205 [Ceraceosorus guamensis]|uniref:Inhibitor I9 domain-containing protein n=1 Tax=Ceraceosorus guamensis TaxID=1522189 RepID=A0A316WD41_9BASI|nr:hypothetical protein IE81DRAFT_320205 [Ceraceosorus guamensis]PWN45445.1 hypothetical protein IE81DRAFT_320205 [Ceraceosorus guamensis]